MPETVDILWTMVFAVMAVLVLVLIVTTKHR